MYHHSESMVAMLEDMQRNCTMMEAEVKMMLEQEGRSFGIELDRRKGARDLMNQLATHIAAQSINDEAMTWAYIDEAQANYDTAEPTDYQPASTMITETAPVVEAPAYSSGDDGYTDEDDGTNVEPENLP